MSIPSQQKTAPQFTHRQGEYLAFIYYYSKVNRRPPSEADIQQYFGVSSASTHQMVKTLMEKRLISKEPGKPRSMIVLVPQATLPQEW